MSNSNLNSNLLSSRPPSRSRSAPPPTVSGRTLYQTNPLFRDVATFMEHPESRAFFNRYLRKRSKLEEILLFLHLYAACDERASQDSTVTPYDKLEWMFQIMNDSEWRRQVTERTMEWIHTCPLGLPTLSSSSGHSMLEHSLTSE
jgi:hypothetical protein